MKFSRQFKMVSLIFSMTMIAGCSGEPSSDDIEKATLFSIEQTNESLKK